MKRRKKLLALALCLCLALLLLPPVSSAAEGLTFVAINDTLPPELVGAAYSYGGSVYLPYWAFTTGGFGIYYSYFTENSTAYLYSADKEMFFKLSEGVTFDGDGNYYSTPAILRNNTVYLPLSFMHTFFGGFTYSTIKGSPYGDIIRLKSGAEVLTDGEFLRAAGTAMQVYYENYKSSQAPAVTPEADPGGWTGNDREGLEVSLNFIGLPDDRLLDTLAGAGAGACFFLTAEELRADPDMVRRIAGEGYALGIYCREELAAEYGEASALLFEAARVRTLLVTAPESYAASCAREAEEADLVFCPWGLNAVYPEGAEVSAYAVTSVLEFAEEGTAVFMDCASAGETLEPLLVYLSVNKCSVSQLRETG